MPRLIFKSTYLKGKATRHIKNFVRYISTRDGSEAPISDETGMSATKRQKNIIGEIIQEFPEAKELLEYQDFEKTQTSGHAHKFIEQVLDTNAESFDVRKNYVEYIANRPRVEKKDGHGLFGFSDEPIELTRLADSISRHEGNVWTNIISLSREDASRLGYETADAWKRLLRAHTPEIAGHMKILSENLVWYAAFHNESHHPHVHMIAFSKNRKEGYLTEQGIENIRATLAKDIFRQDIIQIYNAQTIARDDITQRSREIAEELCTQIDAGVYENEKQEALLTELALRLKDKPGKKVYGYCSREEKNLVESIVDELERDYRIAALYDEWYKQRYAVLRNYTDQIPPKIPLSKQNEFKAIRNIVVRAAYGLSFGQKRVVQNQTVDIPDIDMKPESEDAQTVDANAINNDKTAGHTQYNVISSNQPVTLAVTSLFKGCCRMLQTKTEQEMHSRETKLEKAQHHEISEKRLAHGIRG
ncbi:MAG: MobP3 family relaxase [Saccharofermentanales bacterium]